MGRGAFVGLGLPFQLWNLPLGDLNLGSGGGGSEGAAAAGLLLILIYVALPFALAPVTALGGSIYGTFAAHSREEIDAGLEVLRTVRREVKAQESIRDLIVRLCREQADLDATPLGRLANPDEVGRAVLAVATTLDFTTGAVIAVDGGRPLGN